MERKVFGAEVKKVDEENLTVEHFITTERLDRSREILRANGMRVKGRVVVLMAHGSSSAGTEPIAKNLELRKGVFKDENGVVAKTQFFDGSRLTPPDSTGRRLFEKATQGYMPNWAVGYIPLKWEDRTDASGRYREITEWELLEYSSVGVGTNPDAVVTLGFKVIEEKESVLGRIVHRILEHPNTKIERR